MSPKLTAGTTGILMSELAVEAPLRRHQQTRGLLLCLFSCHPPKGNSAKRTNLFSLILLVSHGGAPKFRPQVMQMVCLLRMPMASRIPSARSSWWGSNSPGNTKLAARRGSDLNPTPLENLELFGDSKFSDAC